VHGRVTGVETRPANGQPSVAALAFNRLHRIVVRRTVRAFLGSSMHPSLFFSVILVAMVSTTQLSAQSACQQCLQEKLETSKATAIAATALSALAGAKDGAVGAACGAITGAVGTGIHHLNELASCHDVCTSEADEKTDRSHNCAMLLVGVKR
jgi:phage tail tape-measure protein